MEAVPFFLGSCQTVGCPLIPCGHYSLLYKKDFEIVAVFREEYICRSFEAWPWDRSWFSFLVGKSNFQKKKNLKKRIVAGYTNQNLIFLLKIEIFQPRYLIRYKIYSTYPAVYGHIQSYKRICLSVHICVYLYAVFLVTVKLLNFNYFIKIC